VDEAIAKADTLIEAMGWIRRFRGKTTVIKLGGSLLDDERSLQHLLLDVIFMESVGMRPVIVHGGGKAITRALQAEGIEPHFIRGRRVTDDRTLTVVERVLATELCEQIVEQIERLSGRAVPLNFRSTCVLHGEVLQVDEDDGQPIQLGHVGHVTSVDRQTIESFLHTEQVPVIPSMCWSPTGGKLNVNADTAAMAVAQSLGAEKLVFVSDVNGVRRDKDEPNSVIGSLTAVEAREMIASGIIKEGMIPKVEACIATLGQGVQKIHIIDGRLRHSLLLEIYTTRGVGTELIRERPATLVKSAKS
jgi:acetylglutamate kinase